MWSYLLHHQWQDYCTQSMFHSSGAKKSSCPCEWVSDSHMQAHKLSACLKQCWHIVHLIALFNYVLSDFKYIYIYIQYIYICFCVCISLVPRVFHVPLEPWGMPSSLMDHTQLKTRYTWPESYGTLVSVFVTISVCRNELMSPVEHIHWLTSYRYPTLIGKSGCWCSKMGNLRRRHYKAQHNDGLGIHALSYCT